MFPWITAPVSVPGLPHMSLFFCRLLITEEKHIGHTNESTGKYAVNFG